MNIIPTFSNELLEVLLAVISLGEATVFIVFSMLIYRTQVRNKDALLFLDMAKLGVNFYIISKFGIAYVLLSEHNYYNVLLFEFVCSFCMLFMFSAAILFHYKNKYIGDKSKE